MAKKKPVSKALVMDYIADNGEVTYNELKKIFKEKSLSVALPVYVREGYLVREKKEGNASRGKRLVYHYKLSKSALGIYEQHEYFIDYQIIQTKNQLKILTKQKQEMIENGNSL